MNAIQKRCRPKHQVLVLKCYPRTTKGAVDVKPNSSELSYLLFYAQSRRTKITKVGSFLEKKTASDVYRQRIGNVQVTLQILTALIEKSPKDLPLIAPCVLKILDLILRSNDITMVESSVSTFEAFCEHHDAPSLLADQAYAKQYVSVIRQYAALASTRSSPGKVTPSKPVSMRWRNAGLEAIKSVAMSEALSSISTRQYDLVVPMILENLWTDNEDFLDVLLHRAQIEEKVDTGTNLRRRMSNATVQTIDTVGDTNPIALSGSAVDVDKLAEEDIGVLAVQCLKQIYIVPNRAQIHAATIALLNFIRDRVAEDETVLKTNASTGKDSGWATKIYGWISRWAPVQDRYTILATTLEIFSKSPAIDGNLPFHIVLAAMIGSLLRSDVNLIGLSVMDVLLQLMAQIKKLVQMPGDPNTMRTEPPGPGQPDPRSPTTIKVTERADELIAQRKELLNRLQRCIGDLATHVYYADQISDMISTILGKMRPSRSNSTASSSPHGEKADGAAGGPSGSTGSVEDNYLDTLMSLTIAKTAALKSIKSILLVANPRTKMTGTVSLARNRVPIQVWEGTQWLLRDPDGHVRKAYADALLTWLDRETTRQDLKARDETLTSHRTSAKPRDMHSGSQSRRVVSSASHREKPTKERRSHFLQLFHLAIYDNAVQYVEYETDIVLLHVLLTKLVYQLGVNAVKYGLAMIFRLQEDIQDAETPLHKVRIGSLCHGYFWALTDKFDFEGSVVGRAIHNEIIRRRSKHFWVEGVHVPPPITELVGTPGLARPQPKMGLREVESEALLPFDDRMSLIECISSSYQEHSAASPPVSPASSPGRSFTQPILSSQVGGVPTIEAGEELPPHLREQMLVEWTREGALAAAQEGSKSASLNGSRTGTTGTIPRGQIFLAVNGSAAAPNGSPAASQTHLRPTSSPAGNLVPLGVARMRKTSARSNRSPARGSAASTTRSSAAAGDVGGEGFVTSVDQLKLALTGQLAPQTPGTSGLRQATAAGVRRAGSDSGASARSGSDSMVSYDDGTPSEPSIHAPVPAAEGAASPAPAARPSLGSRPGSASRPGSGGRKPSSIGSGGAGGPLTSHPPLDNGSDDEGDGGGGGGESTLPREQVPPVPPLPSGLDSHARPRPSTMGGTASPSKHHATRRSVRSRGGESKTSSSWALGDEGLPTGPAAAQDLQSLLQGIDSRAGEKGLGNVSRPPY